LKSFSQFVNKKKLVKEAGPGKILDNPEREENPKQDFTDRMQKQIKPDRDTLPGYVDPNHKRMRAPDEEILNRNTSTPVIKPHELNNRPPAPQYGSGPRQIGSEENNSSKYRILPRIQEDRKSFKGYLKEIGILNPVKKDEPDENLPSMSNANGFLNNFRKDIMPGVPVIGDHEPNTNHKTPVIDPSERSEKETILPAHVRPVEPQYGSGKFKIFGDPGQ